MNSKILCINTGKLFVDLAIGCACALVVSEAHTIKQDSGGHF